MTEVMAKATEERRGVGRAGRQSISENGEGGSQFVCWRNKSINIYAGGLRSVGPGGGGAYSCRVAPLPLAPSRGLDIYAGEPRRG
jgi:hypothetical protein